MIPGAQQLNYVEKGTTMSSTTQVQTAAVYEVGSAQLETLRSRIAEVGEQSPWEVRSDYSGPGMGKAQCVAVVLDDPKYGPAVTAELAAVLIGSTEVCAESLLDVIWELPSYRNITSTGAVIYWPNVHFTATTAGSASK